MTKLLIGALCLGIFIFASSMNFEYLLNRQSNSLATFAAIVVEMALIFFFIYKPIIKPIIKHLKV